MKPCRMWLLRGVLALLLAGWVCLLHAFSAQSAAESSALSGGLCFRIAQLTVSGFEAMPEAEQAAIVAQFQKPVRKTAHFCEYGVGGVLTAALLATVPLSRCRRGLCGGGFGLLNAALDEGHQHFVAGRAPGFGDVLLDTCGFVCGMTVLLLVLWLWQKRRKA